MSNVYESGSKRDDRRVTGLRANSFAAVVMLVIEFGLGVAVNLYTTLPASDKGKSLLPAFGRAVTGGPIVLSIHAILGTLLLVTGISVVVRASLLRRKGIIAVASVGLLSIVMAWQAGARFVGHNDNASSMAMAIATAITILCYVTILLVVPPRAKTGETP
jgi:hypothetical protein